MHNPAILQPFLPTALSQTHFTDFGPRYKGKVRDVYDLDATRRLLVATDRQSAFDILWTTIPLKGQVLTQISSWWFEKIKDIMPTHVLALPDPNVVVVKNLKMIRIEIVVRGYLTGSTGTSAWVNYEKGMRTLCGAALPDGMRKNQPFPQPIITPTTKAEEDEPISPEEIVAKGYVTQVQWEEIATSALKVFARGQEIARSRGLILVDTKYEMGYDQHGVLTIADEVHTPDSSRYWVADTYTERFAAGQEPESLDKEFFRLWLRQAGFDPALGHESPRPAITDEVRLMLAAKYIDLYERMTGETFVFPENADVTGRIERNVRGYQEASA